MSIRRAMPVVVTDDPVASREFYECFLGSRAEYLARGPALTSKPIAGSASAMGCGRG